MVGSETPGQWGPSYLSSVTGTLGVTSRWWTPADARPSRTPSVRRAAADALDALGWTPQTEPDAIAYWIATEQWEKCSGDVAVGPLIDVLGRANERVCIGAAGALGRIADPRAIEPLITVSHEDCDDPKFTAAAEALVAMYHSGKLDDEARALVWLNVTGSCTHGLGRRRRF